MGTPSLISLSALSHNGQSRSSRQQVLTGVVFLLIAREAVVFFRAYRHVLPGGVPLLVMEHMVYWFCTAVAIGRIVALDDYIKRLEAAGNVV